MGKLVVLSLGPGNLQTGFDAVTAQLWEPEHPQPMKSRGSLPPAPGLADLYRGWQLLYLALSDCLNLHPRLEVQTAGITNVSEVDFQALCQQLQTQLNLWLNSEAFHNIDQQLRTYLSPTDEIQLILETSDPLLWRLPWHLWSFFENYPHAEVALSLPEYRRLNKSSRHPSSSKVRILAILGNSTGLDIEHDRVALQRLSGQAEVTFLVEPKPDQLNDQLWEHGWDVFFFAGHSFSQIQGVLQLNAHDTLTISQLRYALTKAIANGLQLAILNSCDGLGLAQALADLHIPQLIVMREPIPDQVAHEFLNHFLSAFVGGQSLYGAVRTARERLQRLEGQFPCASWLPVICQNPAEISVTWQDWCHPQPVSRPRIASQNPREFWPSIVRFEPQRLLTAMGLGLMVAALIIGLRQVGLLQQVELQIYDYLMRSRPDERPDPRLLIVSVTEQDIQQQNQVSRQGSLSDSALAQLLTTLNQSRPRVIGLDIYRDFPTAAGVPGLAQLLRQTPNLVALCKVSDLEVNDPGISPPPEVPIHRLGFSDFLQDEDGILRRHLLAFTPNPASPCTTPYAFNVQLALHYLATENIALQATSTGQLQLGSLVAQRLNAESGGYNQIDADGHQVLLNYRANRDLQRVAQQVTLSEVLTGRVHPSAIRDRIILIGVTATSSGDYWSTPYSHVQRLDQQIPGVIVQAHMTSQILSAVLDRRPLLQTWPKWVEMVWILGWSWVGGAIACYPCSAQRWGLLLGLAAVTTNGISLLYFINAVWIPFAPSAIALVMTSVGVRSYKGNSMSPKPLISLT
jgi:CHASE2 domain-containing sensor protein